MKTIVTALISQQIKTNLQIEADSKGITLSKLIYKKYFTCLIKL